MKLIEYFQIAQQKENMIEYGIQTLEENRKTKR